jgi:hypothetical protein
VLSAIKLDRGKVVSTPGLAPLRAFAHRRSPRCPLAVPVRVTVLRAGAAYSIPGRSLDLGEGGIAVVLAGEVRPADSVGVEFLLPDLGLGLQAKAVVRHNAPLRCGFEFRGLTRHQQAVIREWVRQRMQVKSDQKLPAAEPELDEESATSSLLDEPKISKARSWRSVALVAAALVLVGLLVWWWHWQNGWEELERHIPQPTSQVIMTPGAQVLAFESPPLQTMAIPAL